MSEFPDFLKYFYALGQVWKILLLNTNNIFSYKNSCSNSVYYPFRLKKREKRKEKVT